MNPLEIGPLGRPGLECRNGIAEAGEANALEHGIEALGALGVARAGQMIEVCRMGSEQHGHAAGRYPHPVESELPFPS